MTKNGMAMCESSDQLGRKKVGIEIESRQAGLGGSAWFQE